MKKIIVTGASGQDGSIMCDYLLALGHKVFGVVRRSASPDLQNLEQASWHENFQLVYADVSDEVSVNEIVQKIQPNYFVNFAANSFVGCSWDMPLQVFDVNTLGVLRCLEAVRKYAPTCRFYNAGSSEEFGDVVFSPQNESHPLRPRSPYGASKASARHLVKVYRDSYSIYAIQGWLFNHEGVRRSPEFVTRKITKGVARIKRAIEKGQPFEPVELGNLDTKRDWSDSEDFVDAIWRMLNQDRYRGHIMLPMPALIETGWLKEYVVASGENHTIREFVELAFKEAGIDGVWRFIDGDTKNQLKKCYIKTPDLKPGQVGSPAAVISYNDPAMLVKINPKFYRPAEVNTLCGDSSLIRKELKWIPKVSFEELVKKMVQKDLLEFSNIYLSFHKKHDTLK